MTSWFEWLFGAATFVPHGFCLAWRPDLLALHAGSDLLTAGAYFAIPAAIWTFVSKRPDLSTEHRRLALLFVTFIVACGLTHLVGLATLWAPLYGAQGLIKLVTGMVSAATAVLVWRLVPQLLALPSPEDLATANAKLRSEIEAKNSALTALQEAREGLEAQVLARTQELRARADELETVNARFAEAIAGSHVTMFEQDRDLRYTWIANPAGGLSADKVLGRRDSDLMSVEDARHLAALKRRVLVDGERALDEAPITLPSGRATFRTVFTPLRQGGAIVGLRAVAADITSLRETEERLRIVMQELSHRSKNLLAVVSSLIRQIGRATGAPASFVASVSERLQALARAHDVLTAVRWARVPLATLVDQQLAPLDVAGRVRIEADDEATIAPDAAQMLALAVHELATNALKHGSLSRPEGGVALRWAQENERIKLSWIEHSGPPTSPPNREGFGLGLLSELVPRALRGEARLEHLSGGLRYALSFPAGA